jgi:hypothetical protein
LVRGRPLKRLQAYRGLSSPGCLWKTCLRLTGGRPAGYLKGGVDCAQGELSLAEGPRDLVS